MRIGYFAGGAAFAVRRAFAKYVAEPRQRRALLKKNEPFNFTNWLGQRFELDPSQYVDRRIFIHGIYERRFLDFVVAGLRAGGVMLDIGANIGNHSIYLAPHFKTIHAFEPNPNALARLKRNIALNGIDNIIVHPVGLGKADAVLPFRENNDGNLGASGFVRDGELIDSGSRIFDLKIANADAYIDTLALDQINLIKIDVEGWEAPVFEGLAKSIARHRPVVAFELFGADISPTDYASILSALPGYILAELRYSPADGTLLEKVRWNTLRQGQPTVSRLNKPEPRTYENILAFPNEGSLKQFTAS